MSIEQVRDHHISKVNRSVENQPVAARSGARILVDALRTYNARFAFCVPGESYLAVLDALYDVRDELKLIVCRQEGGVGFMAEAYGKVTGTPGIALVTRAPGALNASIGVHTAFQDSTPMILLIGQVTRAMMEREAFQEIDYRRIFSPIAKWVAQIDDVNRIPEFISRAYHVAMSGRRGPVVLALPEDVLSASATVVDGQCYKVARAYPGDSDMAKLQELLSQAQRPLMILGGSGWTRSACQDIERFATNYYLPVACSFRRQDLFNNDSPNYVGDVGIGINPKLAEMIKRTDLLIVVGARLGEMASSGYTLLAIPRPVQTLVHVHPGAEELGRVYQSDLPVHANMDAFAERVAQMAAPISCAWREWTDGAHAGYMKQSEPITQPFAVDMGAIIATLRRALPRNAILTNGAGNYAAWAHRYYRFSEFGTQIAPTSGSMGYGLPAAIAAKLAAPERTVICLSGDGCFLMTGQELATAVRYHLNIVILIVNNQMYGTIRMHQERHYPERVYGTDLVNPDFVAYARSFGAAGTIVRHTSEFEPALVTALAASGPTIIELRVDPEALTPSSTLSEIRSKALSAKISDAKH